MFVKTQRLRAKPALGDTKKAIELHEQNLAIAREIADRWSEGTALGNLGMVWSALDPLKAIEFHEQHLAIARAISDRRGEGLALGKLGIAYRILGDTRKAIAFHEQHFAISREVSDRRGEADASFNKAEALAELGNYDEAVQCADYALGIFMAIESPRADSARLKLAEWGGRTSPHG